MNPTPSMVREAALVLARHVQSRREHDPEWGPGEPDPAPWLPLARDVLSAALADHLAAEGVVYRADVAAAQARVAELEAEVEGLRARVAPWRTVMPGQGAA